MQALKWAHTGAQSFGIYFEFAERLIRSHQEEKVDGSCVKSNSYQLIINLAGAFVGGGLNECNHVPNGDGTMMNFETCLFNIL